MTQVAQQPAQPAATVATAASLLERYSAASLQQMARHRGINPAGKNKAELVRLLARDLFEPQRIGAALAGLQPNEGGLLDRLSLMGGEAPAEALRRHLEREGLVAR